MVVQTHYKELVVRYSYKLADAPRPTSPRVNRILATQARLRDALLQHQSRCWHRYLPVGYRESDVDGGYVVGVFDTTLVCNKCSYQTIREKSPPLCQDCCCPLRLRSGKVKELGLSGQAHRYVCTKKDCPSHGKIQRFITGGD